MKKEIALLLLFLVMFETIIWLGYTNQMKDNQIMRLNSGKTELSAQVTTLNGLVTRLTKLPPSPQSTTMTLELADMVAPVAPTGSMEPVLNGTNHVLLTKESVSVGDIAVYDNGNQTIIHRIIGETLDGLWIFSPDANPSQKEFVPKDRVIWRVKAIIY